MQQLAAEEAAQLTLPQIGNRPMMPRNTELEERLAVVLFDATSGMRSGVPWEACMGKGLWLADAARILGAYQQRFLADVEGLDR